MAQAGVLNYSSHAHSLKVQLYLRVWLLSISALVICGAVIIRSMQWSQGSFLADMSSLIELPYMISAVVAAMTAVAVITILPTARSIDPAERLVDRLREMGDGDLTTRLHLKEDGQLREIAHELNQAVTSIGHQVSTLKVVNRQQWQSLCEIRGCLERGNPDHALKFVEEMERNWSKIAEIEKKLTT
jgi:pentatricopeptide repeat protein